MANVFLLYMPPGNAEAMVHYQDTIQQKVALSRIAPHISANLRANLVSIFGQSPIAVWGSAGGPRNRTNFERMSQGDDLLIVEGDSIKLIGKVAAKVESKGLSRELWRSLRGNGDISWELIYFIANPRELDVPFAEFCTLFGYAQNFQLRGFTPVAPARLQEFYKQYDDLYSILVRIQKGEPVSRRVTDLVLPADAPAPELVEVNPEEIDEALRAPIISEHVRIQWKLAPSLDDMLAAYPAKAKAAKVGGTAALDCRLNKTGGISGCDILREAPQGYGFGVAARSLRDRFSGPLVDSQGETLASARVTLAFAFPVTALEGSASGIGRPQWTALPTPADMAAVMPAAAAKAGVYKARVVMECQVVAEGALAGCAAQTETPPGLGYGDAAIRLASAFRLSVWTDEGLPSIGGKVRVPIRFDLDTTAPAAK